MPEEELKNLVCKIYEGLMESLPAQLVSNILKATNQLINIPATHFEGWNNRLKAWNEAHEVETRAKTEVNKAIIESTGLQMSNSLHVPGEYVEAAMNKAAQKIVGERLNIDQICFKSFEDIKDNPPTEDADNEIDIEWLTTFEEEAKSVSSKDMQLLFSRILTEEIKQPNTFSVKAIRTLRGFTKECCEVFRRACSMATETIGDYPLMIFFPSSSHTSLGKDIFITMREVDLLQEYGLIHINKQTTPYSVLASPISVDVIFKYEKYTLKGPSHLFVGYQFSSIGKQLSILCKDSNINESYLEMLKHYWLHNRVEQSRFAAGFAFSFVSF